MHHTCFQRVAIATVLTCIATLAVYQPFQAASAQSASQASKRLDTRNLEGYWTNVSMTPLQRPASFSSLNLDPEAAAQLESARVQSLASQNEPTLPDAPPPTIGQGVIGYNTFWLDGGNKFGVVRGEARTSWIVDPIDGRIPYTPAGKAAFDAAMIGQEVADDGPEVRTVGERCLIGFGSTGGPPMLNVGYNNRYQIVQTERHVAILVEMNHDARIIRLGDAHRGFPQWLGDSVGRWEGDTLIVETRGFRDEEQLRYYRGASFYISKNAVVRERFSRVAEDQLLYEFEVDDPLIASSPWRGEMTFLKSTSPVFEYACHEGNHSMPNILLGARRLEANTNFGKADQP